ncbi:MAG: hypothetical protein ABJJ39_08225 [Kangiellaceae bacterium]
MIQTSSYYLENFVLEKVEFYPASKDEVLKHVDDIASYDHGYIELEEFGIYMIADNGRISEKIIRQTKDILSQVVELDDYVRSRPSDEEHSYDLINIEIRENIADFKYCSNECNATWYALFEKKKGTWKFEGLG